MTNTASHSKTTPQTLTVELGDRSYPIHIGQNLLNDAELLVPHIHGSHVMVVSNTTVAPLYLDKVLALLTDFQVDSVILPDGEQYKNMQVLNQVFDGLLEKRHDRKTTLVALGGGVVGDMTGFAAACYQRGVHFIQIPTTLLSQVDSSVGGKTGVNHPQGKNMLGAFWQPQVVLADTDTLNTLEDRELRAGIAEVIKYGLLGDFSFFEWLEQNVERLNQRDPEALAYAIYRSCWDKAQIVAEDEREAGKRALLNLGHTFGHAIETGTNYTEYLHGEAVAIGMCMAADMSVAQGWLTQADAERAKVLISKAGLPVVINDQVTSDQLTAVQFMQLMGLDKKVANGQLRLVLLKALGEAVLTSEFSSEALEQTLTQYTS